MGSKCPANIEMTCTREGLVQAIYHKTHAGHGITGRQIMHIPLHKKHKDFIIQKSLAGVPAARIHREIADEGGRGQFISMQDVNNHINLLGFGEPFNYHNEDPRSVHHFVEELDSQVLFYEAQTESNPNFNLVLMFKQQEEYMKLQLSEKRRNQKMCVAMDSTHGLGQGKFKLITLMHIASDTDRGMPVLYCISTNDDTSTIENMLKYFKERVGEIQADVFMSDDSPTFRNAWTKIFEAAKKYLLCTWHVKKAVWKNIHEMIPVKEDKKTVNAMFKNVCDETNLEIFKIKLDNFQFWLEKNGFIIFLNYFKKTYIARVDQEDRICLWAKAHRKGIFLHYNNHVENYHKVLKYVHFGGTTITRIDKVIYVLGELVWRKIQKRLCDLLRGRKKLQKGFYERCKKAKEYSVNRVSDTKYNVSSEGGELHEVIFLERCNCLNTCADCGVCRHVYECDCEDYTNENVCKHIHAVGFYTNDVCEKSKPLTVETIDDKFKVSSKDGISHEVIHLQNCVCLQKCKCGICKHQYKCNCNENTMCKHIHAVGHVLNDIITTQIFDNSEEDEDEMLEEEFMSLETGRGTPTFEEYMEDEFQILGQNCLPEKNEQEKIAEKIFDLINKITNSVKTKLNKPNVDVKSLKEMHKMLKKFHSIHSSSTESTETKSNFNSSTQSSETIETIRPSNAKIQLQPTYKSTKKKRKGTMENPNTSRSEYEVYAELLLTMPIHGQPPILDIMNHSRCEHSYS